VVMADGGIRSIVMKLVLVLVVVILMLKVVSVIIVVAINLVIKSLEGVLVLMVATCGDVIRIGSG